MASDLIARIEDKDLEVVRAARAALHAISGEDFGPFGEADADDRADAAKRWRTWRDEHRPAAASESRLSLRERASQSALSRSERRR